MWWFVIGWTKWTSEGVVCEPEYDTREAKFWFNTK